MSEHNRRLERKELNATIGVRNVITNDVIGELVNLTIEGLMIISDREMDTNSIFQFQLLLPEAINGSDTLDIGVDCLWCRGAENFDRYWSGYQIIDASPEAVAAIETLLTQYST